jgi:flavodoxin
MKALIVFYSRTGTTKRLAEAIAKELKADIEEIIDKTNRKGILNFLPSGRDAMKKKLTQIEKIKKDPSKYDIAIIGTPNWAGNMTPAIRTYIGQNKSKFKKVAFFCTQGGSAAQETFREMEIISKKPVSVLQLRTGQVMKNDYENEMKNFLNDLKKK